MLNLERKTVDSYLYRYYIMYDQESKKLLITPEVSGGTIQPKVWEQDGIQVLYPYVYHPFKPIK